MLCMIIIYIPPDADENRLQTKTGARRTGRKHGPASDPPPATRPGKNTPFGAAPHSDSDTFS